MSFLDSMNISASALSATRLRMDVVAENMANSNTTRGPDGEPYRRKYVVYQERKDDASNWRWGSFRRTDTIDSYLQRHDRFAVYLNEARNAGDGVRVVEIGTDMSEFKYDYNPSHPDADENGYVRMPNIEVVQEMVDMMSAYRAYEANVTALNTFKDMALKTLELGR